MKKYAIKLTVLAAALSLASVFCAERAQADYRLSFTANEEGLSLRYGLPFIGGFGKMELTEGGPGETIDLRLVLPTIPLASLTLSVAEINAEATPPSIKIHYEITDTMPSIKESTGDFEIPFCTGEIKIGLFKLLGWQVKADHDLKIFMFLKKKKTLYDFVFASDDMTGEGSGKITAEENTITFELASQVSDSITVELVFDYSQPLMTKCTYTINLPGSPLTGTLSLPNARYRLWFDML